MALADILLVLAVVLDSLLVIIFLRQRLHKEFPFFFGYIVSCVLIMAIRQSVKNDYVTYFKVYWGTEPIYAVLTLAALHEAFRSVFVAFYKFWWFWFIFPATVAAISGYGLMSAIRHPPAQATLLIAVILSLAKSINYVEAGLFGVFFLLVWLLGLRWQNHAFGIVMGFAAYALGAGYSFAARSAFGTKFNSLAKYGPPVAYILAVIIWLIVFLVPSRPRVPQQGIDTVQPEQLLSEVRHYTRILKGVFGKHQ